MLDGNDKPLMNRVADDEALLATNTKAVTRLMMHIGMVLVLL